jgi:tRNA dimethylallyltransferase
LSQSANQLIGSSANKTVFIVLGPTSVGKTAVAVEIARYFDTAIISADSRQCYRELNIGVAKPTVQELSEVKHYFINSHSVHDTVNAASFEQLALGWVHEIFSKNNIAVMVGGTGLYIDAFCHGLDAMPAVPAAIREELKEAFNKYGITWLQAQVAKEDPLFAEKGEMQNPQRIMRALEIKRSTGQSILSFQKSAPRDRPFDIVKIGLELPREQLYKQVNERTDGMMKAGLLEEATPLFPLRHLNALQTVGYSELFEYMEGKISLDTAVELIKQHTRNYAKRQLTWFKKDAGVYWFSPNVTENIVEYCNVMLRSF